MLRSKQLISILKPLNNLQIGCRTFVGKTMDPGQGRTGEKKFRRISGGIII